MSDRPPVSSAAYSDPLCSYCEIRLSEHEEITPLCEEAESHAAESRRDRFGGIAWSRKPFAVYIDVRISPRRVVCIDFGNRFGVGPFRFSFGWRYAR